MEELIASVSPNFDWIVIDAPPVLAVTDAVELSRAADAVLLVARGASTPYEVAQRTKTAFGTARILGFVLNAVKEAPGKRSYNYNYNYYYHANPEAERPGSAEKELAKDWDDQAIQCLLSDTDSRAASLRSAAGGWLVSIGHCLPA